MLGKTRMITLAAAVVVTASLALVHQATASHQFSHKAFSGGATFKGLVVKTEANPTSVTDVSPEWQLIDSRGFQIPAGDSQLVVVDFSAETECAGTGFCLARARIGRTLGTAQLMEPGGITALDTGQNFLEAESHAMTRTLCVRNATASPVDISVFMEAQRGQAEVTTFNFNDFTFKIARNSTCTPSVDI